MDAKLTILLGIFLAVSVSDCKPADQEALDKATANDVVINSVNPDKGSTAINPEAIDEKKTLPKDSTNTNSDAIYHTSVSFATPTYHTAKPGGAVARIIDDIFQIPIGVLQSVARLLRNPFISHKTPETTGSY